MIFDNIYEKEYFLQENELIVSKTNTKGIITYANDIFCKIAEYELKEVLNKPHNMIRHPYMPKCIFKLLWETIKSGKEIFAYVINSTKNNKGYYWVFAHVTPSFDANMNILGFHSNRRKPSEKALNEIKKLYSLLLEEEGKHNDSNSAINASYNMLQHILQTKCLSYEEFVLSI